MNDFNPDIFLLLPIDSARKIIQLMWELLKTNHIDTQVLENIIQNEPTSNCSLNSIADLLLSQKDVDSVKVKEQIQKKERLDHWITKFCPLHWNGEIDNDSIKFAFQPTPNSDFMENSSWQFWISFKFDIIGLKSPYNNELIDSIKEIDGRKWIKPLSFWFIPLTQLDRLQSFIELFDSHFDSMPYWNEVFTWVQYIQSRMIALGVKNDYGNYIRQNGFNVFL